MKTAKAKELLKDRVSSTSSKLRLLPTTSPPLLSFLSPPVIISFFFSPPLSSGWGLVPLVRNHEQAPSLTRPNPAWPSSGLELGPTQQERHINWVSVMCKLMFGEHREKITQIILTAAEENVCVAPLKESLRESFSSFFFFLFFFCLSLRRRLKTRLSLSAVSMIKKQKGRGVAGKQS